MSWHVFFLFVGFPWDSSIHEIHHLSVGNMFGIVSNHGTFVANRRKILRGKIDHSFKYPGFHRTNCALLGKRRSVWTRVPLDVFIIPVFGCLKLNPGWWSPFLRKSCGVFFGDFFDEVLKKSYIFASWQQAFGLVILILSPSTSQFHEMLQDVEGPNPPIKPICCGNRSLCFTQKHYGRWHVTVSTKTPILAIHDAYEF